MADLTLAAAIARFEEARDELRDIIREAHAVTKDLRTLIAEARETRAAVKTGVEETLDEAVKDAVARLSDATQEAMEGASDKVITEFTALSNLCLYGRKDGRVGDEPNLFEEVQASLQRARRDLEAMRGTVNHVAGGGKLNPLGADALGLRHVPEERGDDGLPNNRALRRAAKKARGRG